MTTRQTPDAVREAVALTIADARYHLRKYRPHCLEALEQALAALDSRAGDTVKWRERWHGSEPEKGSAIVDEHGNLIAYLGGNEATHAAVTRIVSAHNATPAPAVDTATPSDAHAYLREVEPVRFTDDHGDPGLLYTAQNMVDAFKAGRNSRG